MHLTLLRQRSDAAPGTVNEIHQRDGAVTGTVLRQAILQPGELQQILNHQLQPLQLPLKALHQHGVVPIDRHLETIAHQRQSCQRSFELMGHVTDPAFLLLLLGLKRLTTLNQNQQPFIGTWKHQRFERLPQLLPFTALRPLLMARADDRLLERGIDSAHQMQTAHQQIAGDVEKTLGTRVDVRDREIRGQDHPSLRGASIQANSWGVLTEPWKPETVFDRSRRR